MAIWKLWECERGARYAELRSLGEPGEKAPCGFSGCDTQEHYVSVVRVTEDRKDAADWFRYPSVSSWYLRLAK